MYLLYMDIFIVLPFVVCLMSNEKKNVNIHSWEYARSVCDVLAAVWCWWGGWWSGQSKSVRCGHQHMVLYWSKYIIFTNWRPSFKFFFCIATRTLHIYLCLRNVTKTRMAGMDFVLIKIFRSKSTLRCAVHTLLINILRTV